MQRKSIARLTVHAQLRVLPACHHSLHAGCQVLRWLVSVVDPAHYLHAM
jgi:hypothetical protein